MFDYYALVRGLVIFGGSARLQHQQTPALLIRILLTFWGCGAGNGSSLQKFPPHRPNTEGLRYYAYFPAFPSRSLVT
jgi:hypothetical protein